MDFCHFPPSCSHSRQALQPDLRGSAWSYVLVKKAARYEGGMRIDSGDRMDELKDVDSAAAASAGSVGNMGTGRNAGSTLAGSNNTTSANGLQYSIPGILHFLQHEWSRFEMERGQWEVERAELNARIAFLQGERKGQENLKNDLVRRIKMLEYALKQERAKYAKLKYGNDASNTSENSKPPLDEEAGLELPPLDGENYIAVSNVNWRQGRQLLRQ